MKKILFSCSLTAALLSSQVVFASNGTISVSGTVLAKTCTITNARDFNVALPTVRVSDLAVAEQRAGATPFRFVLSGCTPKSVITTTFDGGALLDAATGRLKNSATGAKANNVEIGIGLTEKIPISLNGTQQVSTTFPTGGSITLDFIAEYVATGGPATAGPVSTFLTYTLEFQ